MRQTTANISTGMQTSPWIILGSTIILLIVVLVLAFQNTNRERRYMSQLLSAKGAALIRAVEAGARTGMMGMMWGGKQIQRLIEETGRLPDVRYMAVIDPTGRTLAHSDPSKINQPFDRHRKIVHLGPGEHENWKLITSDKGQCIFKVHRHFRPLASDSAGGSGYMQGMMGRHRTMGPADDWFSPENRRQLLIIVGLDVTPFETRIQAGRSNLKDLTGQRFGRLVVLKDTGERVRGRVLWLCACDCGNTCKVRTGSLKSGHTKSCGCWRSLSGNSGENQPLWK